MSALPFFSLLDVPILGTKLHIPPIRREWVSRTRLIERLDQGIRLGRRLALISAPAGFGKTTLLSEWLHRGMRSKPSLLVAWVSLDEQDNELARFLAYLVAALQAVGVEGKESLLSEASAPQVQPPPVSSASSGTVEWAQPLLTALINKVAALPGPVLLVFDDYHLVTAQAIHDTVAFLLEYLPDNAHLVVATRADPPLPIARLRGRGQLTELRQTDLRFTGDEAIAFLTQAMGLELSGNDVVTLASRTEGWIAGLQMAALALQSLQLSPATTSGRERAADHISQFIQAFAGSNRYILDYLIEEVLHLQSASIQSFLLQTSMLERLTGPLCDAVLNQAVSGQQTLEYLERANLFVVPLDDRREWYRYHRLFADLLQRRLRELEPELIPTLHSRASAWYEQRGQMPEAIEHAFSGQAVERAAKLIEQVAQETLMHSKIATLLGWIERLPEELVCASASLCLYHAWALLLIGRSLDDVESRLQALEATGRVPGQVATMRAFLATSVGQVPRAVELSRQVLEQTPKEDMFLRSFASWVSVVSHLSSDDTAAGIQALERIVRQSQQIGNVMVAVSALTLIARTQARQGRLREASIAFERAIAAGTDSSGHLPPVAGRAMISLGDLQRKWNDLDAAERYLEQGIALTAQWRKVATLPGYLALAYLRQAQGDANGANEAMRRAQQVAIEFDATEWDDELVAIYRAGLWVAQGELAAAARWAEQRRLQAEIPMSESTQEDDYIRSRLRRYAHAILVRLLLKQGRPGEALALLEPTLSDAAPQERTDILIEDHILKALALRALGDLGSALAALERALVLAEPGGYVRIFVDEGEPMRELLRQAISRGIAPSYSGTLLDALERETGHQASRAASPVSVRVDEPASPSQPLSLLVEPLTERELEVLSLLATGLSNKAIADTLIIAVGTVKKHLKNIYDKLETHSRTQAVARAQDLGIL